MTILDLEHFNAIQSLQPKNNINYFLEFIKVMEETFWNIPRETLDDNFLTLQTCMKETVKYNGGNNYKIVYMSMDRLWRESNSLFPSFAIEMSC